MQDLSTSAIDARRSGTRIVIFGLCAIVLILLIAAIGLFAALPDAGAFDARVEQLFIENNDLTTQAEIKLLEILAQSGTAFSDTLSSYRVVIFVLLLFATALLVAALVFLVMLVTLNRRMAQIERVGIQVNSLLISREENTVYLIVNKTNPHFLKSPKPRSVMSQPNPRSKISDVSPEVFPQSSSLKYPY